MRTSARRKVTLSARLAIVGALALAACSDDGGGAPQGTLRAAACARRITPVVGENHTDPIYMAGFANDRTPTGVHDDVWARGVVIESRGRKVAMVVLDVIGYFNNEIRTIRSLVNDPGFDAIVVSSTHQHEGPDTMGLWGPTETESGVDLGYLDFVNRQVADCITEATAALEPAEIRFATGDTRGTSLPPFPDLVADGEVLQRLCVGGSFDAQGNCAGGILVEGDPGPIDNPTTPSFQLRRRGGGEIIATLVNYASHPEALGSSNRLITSDFPHYMRQRLEERFGGTAIYMSADLGVLQGPLDVFLADENGKEVPRRTFEFAERMGNILAQRAGDALAAVATWDDSPEIEVVGTGPLTIDVENPYFQFLGVLGVFGRREVESEGPRFVVTSEVQALRIGPAQFAVTPNELDPQIGDKYRAQMTGAEHRFVVGLGNDELGYQMPAAKFNPSCFLCFRYNISGEDPDGECPQATNDCGTVFVNNIGPGADPQLEGIVGGLLADLND